MTLEFAYDEHSFDPATTGKMAQVLADEKSSGMYSERPLSPPEFALLSDALAASQRWVEGHLEPARDAAISARVRFVHSPRVNALSMPDGQIVVFAGLVRLFVWYAELSALLRRFRDWDKPTAQKRSDNRTLALTALQLLPVLYGLDTAFELRVSDLLRESDAQFAHQQVVASLSFVLLHEVGHIERGHFSRAEQQAASVPSFLAIPQEVTSEAAIEFEADEFAIRSIRSEERSGFVALLTTVFMIFTMTESARTSDIVSHPLALNRLSALLACVNQTSDPFQVSTAGVLRALTHFHQNLAVARSAGSFANPSKDRWMLDLAKDSLLRWKDEFSSL